MFKRIRDFINRSKEVFSDFADDVKAEIARDQSKERSPALAAAHAIELPGTEQIILALAAPFRHGVILGNELFLVAFGYCSQKEMERIQKRLRDDFEINDSHDVHQRLIDILNSVHDLGSRLMVLYVASLAIDAQLISLEEAEPYCLDAIDLFLVETPLEDWDGFTKELLAGEIASNALFTWSIKSTCKELMKDPDSPWAIYSFSQIRHAYITQFVDLKRRNAVKAYIESLDQPTFDHIVLAIVAPFRLGLTYGPVSRLFTYGELIGPELEEFRETFIDLFGITDRFNLDMQLERIDANAHLPYFAATGLFYITSSIELDVVDAADYHERMKGYLKTILVDHHFNDWPDLAMSYINTNEEYLIQDPTHFDNLMVELLHNNVGPWHIFSYSQVRDTFNTLF